MADPVSASGVGAVFFDGFDPIYGIAQKLVHLVAIFVKYQDVRHHVLERDGLFEHGGNSVEREEPSAGLVYALSDEVGRVGPFEAVLEGGFVSGGQFLVVESPLGEGHGPAIEPNVDEVR